MWIYPIMAGGWLFTGMIFSVILAQSSVPSRTSEMSYFRWIAFLLAGYNLLRWWMILRYQRKKREQSRANRKRHREEGVREPVHPEFRFLTKDDSIQKE